MNWYTRARPSPLTNDTDNIEAPSGFRSEDLLGGPYLACTIILEASRVAPDFKPQKHDKRHDSLPLIGTELRPTSSITTDDDTRKDDEDVAWSGRLRITLPVRPSRVAVPGLQRIPPCTFKRIANSSSMHRSVSMAARST